jgi:diguanylate cyclase (GGDEF)-like protein/PAS domain S-box-containing protein
MSSVKNHGLDSQAVVDGELELFRTLWRTSSDNMFIVRREPSGEYVSEKCNSSMELTFNMSPGQLEGVALKDVLDQDTYKSIADRYDECIESNKPISYEESQTIDESGERFWITTIVPSYCKEGDVYRILGTSKEVTAIKKAEMTLKEINDRLEIEVASRTIELTKALEKMEKLSTTDKLTGLYNRYKIEDILEKEISRAKRYKGCFGLLMLDIDFFKDVNDKYGHIQGDKVLKEFSKVLSIYTRESDSVGRWGGEEFLVIIPESSEEDILGFANRIRSSIEKHPFDIVGKITVSIGSALYQKGSDIENMISRADSALYISKNNGRNSVNIAY